jgi:hypothetical protein
MKKKLGEGCFYVVAQKRETFKMGYSFKLKFSIAQHYRDEALPIKDWFNRLFRLWNSI